ncbi:hypothetical protein [Streptomyces sp. NPDC087856]|uniref:hypothetical protein n=1 Tax=Streptomyces sp. NPDC087856 TaxID=3365811 RepID=UPI00381F9BA2
MRDEAGFEAETITQIATKNVIPKSTLWAALRGERIPSVPVLAALVRAWGGDEADWLRLRTETEQAVERLRQANDEEKTPSSRSAEVKLSRGGARVNLSRSREQAEIQALPADTPSMSERWDGSSGPRSRHWDFFDLISKRERPRPLRHEDLLELRRSGPTAVPKQVIMQHLQTLHDEDEVRAIWTALRASAGEPTLRTISTHTGEPQSVVSLMFRGATKMSNVTQQRVLDFLYEEGAKARR